MRALSVLLILFCAFSAATAQVPPCCSKCPEGSLCLYIGEFCQCVTPGSPAAVSVGVAVAGGSGNSSGMTHLNGSCLFTPLINGSTARPVAFVREKMKNFQQTNLAGGRAGPGGMRQTRFEANADPFR